MAAPSLRPYWMASAALVLLFLAVFAAIELLRVPVLTDPSGWLGRGGAAAAAAGVGLLVADVVLPVPSSAVMIAHGALFGVAVGGLLSLVGAVGAAALGFALGRRGSRLLERMVSAGTKARADALLERWGALAIVVTRPIPLLAETTAILAGASRMSWARLLGASAGGVLPASVLYALAGASGRAGSSGFVVFGVVALFAGIIWVVGKR